MVHNKASTVTPNMTLTTTKQVQWHRTWRWQQQNKYSDTEHDADKNKTSTVTPNTTLTTTKRIFRSNVDKIFASVKIYRTTYIRHYSTIKKVHNAFQQVNKSLLFGSFVSTKFQCGTTPGTSSLPLRPSIFNTSYKICQLLARKLFNINQDMWQPEPNTDCCFPLNLLGNYIIRDKGIYSLISSA
jgi:hypothetical protein